MKYKCDFKHVDEKTKDRGWFQNQLWPIEGVINGRWPYWLAILLNGTIGDLPDWAIPQIKFINGHSLLRENLTKQMNEMIGTIEEAKKHIFNIIERCLRRGGYLQMIFDWWLWGFGSAMVKERPRIDEETAIILYTQMELHRLIGNPADWGSIIGLEFIGSKKSSGWFPTPQHVAHMMTKMVIGDGDNRVKSICDPCVGAGVFLLEASNYSLNLFGIDIDPLMCSMCEFAGWLFMPWLVYGNKRRIKEFNKTEETKLVVSRELNGPRLLPEQRQGELFSP